MDGRVWTGQCLCGGVRYRATGVLRDMQVPLRLSVLPSGS